MHEIESFVLLLAAAALLAQLTRLLTVPYPILLVLRGFRARLPSIEIPGAWPNPDASGRSTVAARAWKPVIGGGGRGHPDRVPVGRDRRNVRAKLRTRHLRPAEECGPSNGAGIHHAA